MKKTLLLIAVALMFTGCTKPKTEVVEEGPLGNPIVTDIYTADPSAHVFGDTLYIYPSHDEAEGEGFNMKDYHVFTTTDMKHFTDRGLIFSPFEQTTWAKKAA